MYCHNIIVIRKQQQQQQQQIGGKKPTTLILKFYHISNCSLMKCILQFFLKDCKVLQCLIFAGILFQTLILKYEKESFK